jgi:uncharacterized peroxidase-related enzyme
MSFIETIDPEQARGATAEMYEKLKTRSGNIPNYARIFSHRPQLMTAWSELQDCLRENIEPRRYELLTLAAAQAIGSSYCSLAYGKTLRRKYFDDSELLSIARGDEDAPISEAEAKIMELARKTATRSDSVTQEDITALRTLGLSDAEIFDVVAGAAARCFFAKISDALGALPDAHFSDLAEDIKTQLVVGRQIQD